VTERPCLSRLITICVPTTADHTVNRKRAAIAKLPTVESYYISTKLRLYFDYCLKFNEMQNN